MKMSDTEEKPDKKPKKVRSWVFVINNYTNDNWEALKDVDCEYLIMAKEIAPSTGTAHIQGFIHFKNQRYRTGIAKMDEFKRAYLAPARASADCNKDYCSKEGREIFEKGHKPSQGERNDLWEIKDLIDEGGDLMDCFEKNFPTTTRYCRSFEKYISLKNKPRSEPPIVIWRYGKSGSGKTRWAFDTFGSANVYIQDGTQWFDGYRQQKCLVLDDFEYPYNFRAFLRIIDRYPYQVQIKGGYVHINSPYIVITCEFEPEKIFTINHELEQVLRRISEIIHVGYEDLPVEAESKSKKVSFLE